MAKNKYIIKTTVIIFLTTTALMTGVFTPSAQACKPHEVIEYKKTSVICVVKCAPSETYVSIDMNSNHCVDRIHGIYSWLLYVIRFLSMSVGIAVVGGIVWGGIRWLTAQDNAAQLQQAVVVIKNSLIGLFLYLLLFAIVNFLVPGGILM